MALLTVQKPTPAGVAPTYQAAAGGGDTFPNDDGTYLHVKNGDATPTTVTINSVHACDQGFDHDLAVVVPNATERMIGPFNGSRFNDATTGLVGVTYSKVTSLTVAAISSKP